MPFHSVDSFALKFDVISFVGSWYYFLWYYSSIQEVFVPKGSSVFCILHSSSFKVFVGKYRSLSQFNLILVQEKRWRSDFSLLQVHIQFSQNQVWERLPSFNVHFWLLIKNQIAKAAWVVFCFLLYVTGLHICSCTSITLFLRLCSITWNPVVWYHRLCSELFWLFWVFSGYIWILRYFFFWFCEKCWYFNRACIKFMDCFL